MKGLVRLDIVPLQRSLHDGRDETAAPCEFRSFPADATPLVMLDRRTPVMMHES